MVNVILLPGRLVQSYYDQIVEVYRNAFTIPPYNDDLGDVLIFSGRLPYHARWKGFRCVVALDQGENSPAGESGLEPPLPGSQSVVGFAYGFTSQPNTWWRELVTAEMSRPTVQEWLADCFEFVELAVTPAYQGRSIGGQLHDALLAGVSHRTAVLSTLQAETNALRLYRKRGWINLLENFRFPGIEKPFLIMGLKIVHNLDLQSR
jgi:GNAT superfamily N-acetyltransferase